MLREKVNPFCSLPGLSKSSEECSEKKKIGIKEEAVLASITRLGIFGNRMIDKEDRRQYFFIK